MHFDFLTLAAVVAEINAMADARVQQVTMANERALALELYAGRRATLWLDIDPRYSRALLSEEKARRGAERETPLMLLLRRHVRGGRLRRARQLPWERVLMLDIENESGRWTLVAEIMGRYSNLLFLDSEGIVRAALRTASLAKNEARAILPGHPYVPPPPMLRPAPPRATAEEWALIVEGAEPAEPLHRALPRRLAATSPTLAREIVARAAGDPESLPEAVEPAALVDAAAELFAPLESGAWQPHVARDEEGAVVAFAPYELTQSEESEPVESLSEAVAAYFAARLDDGGYAAARRAVATLLAEARDRVQGTLHQLRQQRVPPEEVEGLRLDGELLLAYQWQVPRGASSVELTDYEGNPRRLALDPTMSPVENAQRLFGRYEKKKRAADEVPPRIEAAEGSVGYLDSLASDLALAEERPEIDAVRDALAEGGYVAAKRRSGGGVVRGPRRLVLGEWVVLVGRNARQNDEVTFRLADSDDLWLHARGVPGSHVIVKRAGREPSPSVIEQAARVAAHFSQARGSGEVAVDVTERRHVRRLPGNHPGLVSYRNERTLHVRPAAPDEVESGEWKVESEEW